MRSCHSATRLRDGNILIAGGESPPRTRPSIIGWGELLDPAKGRVAYVGSLDIPRACHTATLLEDGRVLLAGGHVYPNAKSSISTDAVELYDPSTGIFTALHPMQRRREQHSATRLQDGRILVAGGVDFDPAMRRFDVHGSAEVFDPATSALIPISPMHFAREGHTATVLADGRVLIVSRGTAELFDPARGTFIVTGKPIAPRSSHSATRLADGRVLLTGGYSSGVMLASSEVFDPATSAFTPSASLATARRYHQATLLPDGRVLVTGGFGVDSSRTTPGQAIVPVAAAEIYDPRVGRFEPGGSTSREHGHHATVLVENTVWITGVRTELWQLP